jgi:glycosyltransferase involved in cell wall biosynthesis
MLATIIITTFNRASKVVEAIQSALDQDYPHKQIIVIDDGSTDNTRELVEAIEGVEYYYQENQRQGAARNKGLSFARGKYFATLDSDDVWNENFLSESINCLEKHKLDFVFSNWTTIKDSCEIQSAWERSGIWRKYINHPADDWYLLDHKQVREIFINTCPAPSSALVMRRESFDSGWNPKLKIADDWCFILERILKRNCRAAFNLQPLWSKTVHLQNIYDGRNRGKIAKELEIHDTLLMKKSFKEYLTRREKLVFDLRIARGLGISTAYFVKNTFITKESGWWTKTRKKFRFKR